MVPTIISDKKKMILLMLLIEVAPSQLPVFLVQYIGVLHMMKMDHIGVIGKMDTGKIQPLIGIQFPKNFLKLGNGGQKFPW